MDFGFVLFLKKTQEGIDGKKVWLGTQCENARKQYHSAKSKHSRNPTHCSKSNLVQAGKYYKKKMNYYINKHNKATKTKLRNLKSKNPKEYWKIINSIDNKKVDSNNWTWFSLFCFQGP